LLKDAAALHDKKTANRTVIHRPAGYERYAGGKLWKTAMIRPARLMDTVVLDEAQKELIIREISEYLQPKTSQ